LLSLRAEPSLISELHNTGTTQACLFRDNYSALTASGLSVFGLSTDSAKSNTTFATKQSLPYPLLCDPSAKLISAIGMKKSPKGTSRGVIVIDKTGKVTALEQGGPQRTVDVVMGVLPKEGQTSSTAGPAPGKAAESAGAGQASMNGQASEQLPQEGTAAQIKTADTAAEVADSAEKIDEHVELGPSA
jgi:thioredoxin-dependent peroxiredoxin